MLGGEVFLRFADSERAALTRPESGNQAARPRLAKAAARRLCSSNLSKLGRRQRMTEPFGQY
jgi:hypothetical protein